MFGRALSKAGFPSRSVSTGRTCYCSASARTFSSSTARHDNVKPSIANIAEIRKLLPGTSMIKAREALTQSSNQVSEALAWLQKDSAISGAKKATKVGDRIAKEGGIGLSIIVDGGPSASSSSNTPYTQAAKGAIVELNCETDFVGRNEIFQELLSNLSHTAALFPTLAMAEEIGSGAVTSQDIIDIPIEALLDFPLMSNHTSSQNNSVAAPRTVREAILDVISRLGERIHLSRVSAFSNVALPLATAPRRSESQSPSPWLVASAFAHGGSSSSSSTPTSDVLSANGRVGSLLLTQFARPSTMTRQQEDSLQAMRGLARSLARQAAGMPTTSISSEEQAELALYNQEFIMKLKSAALQGDSQEEANQLMTVRDSLQSWGKAWLGQPESPAEPAVSVLALRRWELGETF